MASDVFGIEIAAGGVVDLALAGDAAQRRGLEGQAIDRRDRRVGKAVLEKPVAVGLLMRLGAADAGLHRGDDSVGREWTGRERAGRERHGAVAFRSRGRAATGSTPL